MIRWSYVDICNDLIVFVILLLKLNLFFVICIELVLFILIDLLLEWKLMFCWILLFLLLLGVILFFWGWGRYFEVFIIIELFLE